MWPLASGRPRLWEVDGLIGRVEQARAALSARSLAYAVTAPEEELREAERRANVTGRRVLLVGGEAAALLLAFALLVARGLRRDVGDARRRLTWSGARRWQLALLTGIECAAVAVGGVVAGWIAGSVVGAVVAALADAPVGAVLRESVASPGGLALAAAAALVTAGLVALVASVPARERARIGPADLLAAGALLVIGSLCSGSGRRGAAGADGRVRAPAPPASRSHRPRRGDRGRSPLPRSRGSSPTVSTAPLAPPRRARPRARARRGGRHRGVPHDRVRARAARRGLPGDARARRGRAGRLRGAARRDRARGLRHARPRLRRGTASRDTTALPAPPAAPTRCFA